MENTNDLNERNISRKRKFSLTAFEDFVNSTSDSEKPMINKSVYENCYFKSGCLYYEQPKHIPKIDGHYIDPFCNPDMLKKIKFSDIIKAKRNIQSDIFFSPCQRSVTLSKMTKCNLFFKKEYLQITGSFKERGARNSLLSLTKNQQKLGVVTASAGNHALGLAYQGKLLGISITVMVPLSAPIMKIERCKTFNAKVVVCGRNLMEITRFRAEPTMHSNFRKRCTKEIAMDYAVENKQIYINGYDFPPILAGQGTIGLEIHEQMPNVDYILVPIGGGGLIAGISVAIKSINPKIKIIGIESENFNTFSLSMEKGQIISPENRCTLADGLAAPIGYNSFYNAKGLIDKIVNVSEKSISQAILRLIEIEKSVIEGAGAIGLAALISNKLPECKNKNVCVILSGGNIDTSVLGRCLDIGLRADERLMKMSVTMGDKPGSIAELTRIVAAEGGNIKEFIHQRSIHNKSDCTQDIYCVNIRLVVEVRNPLHGINFLNKKKYKTGCPTCRSPKLKNEN
ncbi:hypothetical protein A3Q56_06302 [Intoshia linei]|uniref:L-serine deaminase n=1 Tax=Intoshia linei TaxID=1819745 RepID=A0A177AX82_9BILA|nr:hypothetical protein A3Q56_06302 [Intoshia linei]